MEKRILFCTNVKDVTALWAQNDLFLKLRDEFSTRYWAYDWTQRERLNNEKQKVNNLNTSRHARNDSKQESRQTKQKTRHTDVHREPVSPGIIPTLSYLWFSHHSTLKLGFSLKTLFSLFLSAHISLFFNLSFFIPPLGGWWISWKLWALAPGILPDSCSQQ